MKESVNLGDVVKDRITGLVGTVTGRAEYLHGAVNLLVEPPNLDGEKAEGRWLFEGRLDLVEK